MIEKIERTLLIICVFALCVSFWFIKGGGGGDTNGSVRVDTLIQERVDTIHMTHTVTKYRPIPSKADTIYIEDNEVAQHIRKTYESDSSYVDTTCTPPATVEYHLMIVTDNNDVDSIGLRFNVDYPKVTQTQTITREITKYKKKHFNYGIQTGVGYGLLNKKPDLYVGFGVQYNF